MKTDDFSKQNLNQYLTLLNEGPLRDMKMYQKCLSFDNPRMFSAYPEMAVGIAKNSSLSQMKRLCLYVRPCYNTRRKWGFMNLLKDGIKGVRAI